MPPWLGDFLREWAPSAGVVVFVLTAIGAGIGGVGKIVYSALTSGLFVSRYRHQAELDSCQKAADRRIAELTLDIERLTVKYQRLEDRFWRMAEAGRIVMREDTPPHGIHRPASGT